MESFLWSPPSDSNSTVVSYWHNYEHKYWLTTERVKLAQEKCEEVNWLAPHDLSSVDWAVKLQLKQSNEKQSFRKSAFF